MDRSRRARIFGEVADLYDRVRPPYPDVLIDAIVARLRGRGRRVLEVGAGTGKATAQLLARGCRVLAVEPDPRMAAVAQARLGGTDGFEIHVSSFETWSGDDHPFDLVFSAQAWHWVDPEVGYRKASDALGDDGILALVWNRPLVEGRPPGITEAYLRHAPHLAEGSTLDRSWRPEGRSREIVDSGLFDPPEVLTHAWSRRYGIDEYLDLLRTQSDHRILEPRRLEALLADIRVALDPQGGLVVPYLSEALVARQRRRRRGNDGTCPPRMADRR